MKSAQCLNCVNRIDSADGSPRCLAFPDGIPGGTVTGAFDHSKPYTGDMGIRFDPEGSRDFESNLDRNG